MRFIKEKIGESRRGNVERGFIDNILENHAYIGCNREYPMLGLRLYKDTRKNSTFTSEAVMMGHPDKVCDIISDAILDTAMEIDSYAHMAVECTIKDDLVLIYGEAYIEGGSVDYAEVAKKVLKEIGYNEEYNVIVKVSEQSPEINKLVDNNETTGAGDQGIMFGYACMETEQYMPMAITYANLLAKNIDQYKKNHGGCGLLPDGKTQVTVKYDENGDLLGICDVLVSVQHTKDTSLEKVRKIIEPIVKSTCKKKLLKECRIRINPNGTFVVGGSWGDSGTTGRKLVVDGYGGFAHQGGGAWSSKDPTKVDRTGAYYCRWVARAIVENEIADECEIQVSYAIGDKSANSLYINCFGTNRYPMEDIYEMVNNRFNFSPENMIFELGLLGSTRGFHYRDTACYGHFGRCEFPWEEHAVVGRKWNDENIEKEEKLKEEIGMI